MNKTRSIVGFLMAISALNAPLASAKSPVSNENGSIDSRIEAISNTIKEKKAQLDSSETNFQEGVETANFRNLGGDGGGAWRNGGSGGAAGWRDGGGEGAGWRNDGGGGGGGAWRNDGGEGGAWRNGWNDAATFTNFRNW